MTRTILWSLIALLLNVAVAGSGSAFPGEGAPCPDGTKEVAVIPFARQSTGTADCETVLTVMNLNKKEAAVTCQFFYAVTALQVGTDASLTLQPGQSAGFSGAGSDPLGIHLMDADAGTSGFVGSARVCSSAKALSIDATLVCDLLSGPVIKDLKVIRKKQKGD